MCTLVPRRIVPLSGASSPFMIFRMVVLPVPLSPITATCSPLFSVKPISSNRRRESKDLDRFSTERTSFPLTYFGSREICISVRASVGFSKRSILSSIFSRLSARLIDFSRLKDFNLAMTSSWCLISCCWFM